MSVPTTSRDASRCPFLPPELWIRIWQELASIPRVVLLRPDTATSRSAESTPVAVPDRVPAILHANQLSRHIGLSIYKTKLQVRGHDNLWETYFFADHDILALDDTGLHSLLSNLQLYEGELNRIWGLSQLSRADSPAWMHLLSVYRHDPVNAITRDRLTPGIENHIRGCLQTPPIANLRGNLESIKRVIVQSTDSQRLYPNLYRDEKVLKNLTLAFPVLADRHATQSLSSYAHRLAAAGVAPKLPDQYRCLRHQSEEPLSHAHPHLHPRPYDLQRSPVCEGCQNSVTAAVARTPLNFPQWLSALAVEINRNVGSLSSRNGHDLVMWWFKQPRYLAYRAPTRLPGGGQAEYDDVQVQTGDANEDDRVLFEEYGAYLHTYVFGLYKQVVTVYETEQASMVPYRTRGGGSGWR